MEGCGEEACSSRGWGGRMRSARMRCDASAGTAAAGAVPSVCVLMASGLEQGERGRGAARIPLLWESLAADTPWHPGGYINQRPPSKAGHHQALSWVSP